MAPTSEIAHEPKWEGKTSAELAGPKAEQVWSILEYFLGVTKWFPTLTTCLHVEGIPGQSGCVRYCAGFKIPVDSDGKVNWVREKLLSIDSSKTTFSHTIIDGNIGLHSYVSTIRALPKQQGCKIEWNYVVKPIKGWKVEDLEFFVRSSLQGMAKRIAEALQV